MTPAVSFLPCGSRTRSHGFTLVELAIAMTVIGFLLAIVLQGQDLIDNARATSAIRQIQEYNAAAMTFRTSYESLPGDIPNPADRLPNCDTTTTCATGGNDNGMIRQYDTTPRNIEIFNFFPHLTRAGLVPGFDGGDTISTDDGLNGYRVQPRSLTKDFFPDVMGFDIIVYTYPISASIYENTGNYFRLPGLHWDKNTLSGKYMYLIDAKIDDGLPGSGNVFLTVPPSTNWASVCPRRMLDGVVEYDPQARSNRCWFTIKADF